jgi:putative NIF3 family GTP cyclohydrolase 1 type 2
MNTKAKELYEQLEKDFIIPGMTDEWAKSMDPISDFLCENFKKRSMGLVCDFSDEISKVYTAVFPSIEVMQRILDEGVENAMLFVHHPKIWDIRNTPEVFRQMDREQLKIFKDRKISIYNLHVPLDNYGEYSTSVSLAKALGIKPEKAFANYLGGLCGVFGETKHKTVEGLKKEFGKAIGHEVSLYNYGENLIKNKTIAVVAGGGNDIWVLEEVAKAGVNTFITGISLKNEHSKKAHEFAEKNKINILGGTHYSTEKFACIEMVKYFMKLGLPAEFISDQEVIEDL